MLEKLQAYKSSFILLFSLLIGSMVGIYIPDLALRLEPIGKIFLNLLFMIIVPLVGVSVMSSIAGMRNLQQLGKIMGVIFITSIIMTSISAILIIVLNTYFQPASGVVLDLGEKVVNTANKLDFVAMFTTNDFVGLFSRSNILALIIFSILTGIAVGQSQKAGQNVAKLLNDINQVIMNVVNLIMKLAPVGLGCYFASLMATQDTQVLHTLGRSVVFFVLAIVFYFIVGSTCYAYFAGGQRGISVFWKNAIAPTAVALGTCSSLGSLPVIFRSAEQMKLNADVTDMSLPLLINFNKGGSSMTTAMKIILAYSALGLPFNGDVLATTLLISVISAMIIGGVPGGAFIGEIFIVGSLGLPIETIPMMVAFGLITDAPATMLNVVHNLNAVQIVDRICGKS